MIILGWRERIELPELGIKAIKIKLDTGQRNSLLHVTSLSSFERGGEEWLRFAVRPEPLDSAIIVAAAPLASRSSPGSEQHDRLLIETPIKLGERTYPVELTLTTEDPGDFVLILGRSALKRGYVIDPHQSYLLDA